MLKHRNRLLAAAGAATATGAIVVCGVTAASAASPSSMRTSTESFQIMQATIPGEATVIAHGAFTATGVANKTLNKILFADGSGLCQFYKRLDRGTFRVPLVHEAGATSIALDERALDDLLDGIAIESEPKMPRRRAARVH